MIEKTTQLVLESRQELLNYLSDNRQVVDLPTSAAEAEYEQENDKLADRIEKLFAELYPEEHEGSIRPDDALYYQSWNWWNNRARILTLGARCITDETICRIQLLLTSEFKDWWINAWVHETTTDHLGFYGQLLIYSNKHVMDRRVHDLLAENRKLA